MRVVENRVFRVALVGCGVISEKHIKSILAAGQTVVALCDVVPEKARTLAAATGISDAAFYTDYEKMLDEVRPDIVHVCTPHDLHASMTVAALDRGIHVLCEKPLAVSEEQLRAILEAERKSTALLGVCHQNRYEPNMRRLKETVGKQTPVGGYANVIWKRDAAYYASAAWRGTKAHEGGGVLINQALHTLDIMQWVCGMPTHVTAHVSNDFLKNEIEVEDTAACTFEGENGIRWQFFATTSGTADFPVQLNLRLASGELVEAQNHQFTVDHRILSGDDDAGAGKWVWGNGHEALIADFYRHVRENQPFWLNGAEGAKVVRLILAAYRSDGKRVTVTE